MNIIARNFGKLLFLALVGGLALGVYMATARLRPARRRVAVQCPRLQALQLLALKLSAGQRPAQSRRLTAGPSR